MHGYLRGAQPVDGSIEQVIRDGQFPKDAVEEVRQNDEPPQIVTRHIGF